MLEDFDQAVPFDVTNRGVGAGAVWSIRDLVIGFVAVFVLFFIFATAIVYPVVEATQEDSTEALAAQAIAVATWDVSMVFIVYYLVRRRGAGWPNLGFRPPLPRLDGTPRTAAWLLGFVLLLYAASIMSVNAYGVLIDLLGLDELKPGQQLPDTFFDHDWLVAMIGVSVVVAAPIAEEVFFRGFLFGGLRRRLPFVAAGLISG
ncbi:MAG TPA: type II CAAX endopeptidase family protein, partial [Dehalococcoidia bacterium]|nr:type II CAAX endopeptidase family protein [Dehalococcoidia bacterium]